MKTGGAKSQADLKNCPTLGLASVISLGLYESEGFIFAEAARNFAGGVAGGRGDYFDCDVDGFGGVGEDVACG
jgi:hypothetical protein